MKKIFGRKHYTETIHYEIEQLARIMKLAATQTFNKLELDITPDEFSALDVISCHSGICQRDLAKLLLKDRANTGRILDALEDKKLVTRFVDTKNNRLVKKMAITEKGYKQLVEVAKTIKNHIEQVEKYFQKDEIDSLQVSLKKFRTNIEKVLELNI